MNDARSSLILSRYSSLVVLVAMLPPWGKLHAPHPTLSGPLERLRDVRLQDHVAENVRSERHACAEYRDALGTWHQEALLRGRRGALLRNVVRLVREAELRRLIARPRETGVRSEERRVGKWWY